MSSAPASQPHSLDMLVQAVIQSLGSALDALRQDLTATVHEHGEEYLRTASERIRTASHRTSTWAKDHPLKAAAVVAGMAVAATWAVRALRERRARAAAAGGGPLRPGAGEERTPARSAHTARAHARARSAPRARVAHATAGGSRSGSGSRSPGGA